MMHFLGAAAVVANKVYYNIVEIEFKEI